MSGRPGPVSLQVAQSARSSSSNWATACCSLLGSHSFFLRMLFPFFLCILFFYRVLVLCLMRPAVTARCHRARAHNTEKNIPSDSFCFHKRLSRDSDGKSVKDGVQAQNSACSSLCSFFSLRSCLSRDLSFQIFVMGFFFPCHY